MLRPPTSTLFPYTTLFRSLLKYQKAAIASSSSRMTSGMTRLSRQGLGTARSSSSASSQRVAARLLRVMLRLSARSEEHTSELQSRLHLVCRLLLEKKNTHE